MALDVLEDTTADASLAGVLVYFPDPWPKKRHHKRRLIQPGFVSLVAAKLRAGGVFELATDWEPYAVQMLDVIETTASFENMAGEGRFFTGEPTRASTKFERRGTALGHRRVGSAVYASLEQPGLSNIHHRAPAG